MEQSSHFEQLRPHITEYEITKHFKRDVGGTAKATAIALDILASNHKGFEQLHKFEEKVAECSVFRAKIQGVHIVYLVTLEHKLIFLRAFKHFHEYERFLEELKRAKDVQPYHCSQRKF